MKHSREEIKQSLQKDIHENTQKKSRHIDQWQMEKENKVVEVFRDPSTSLKKDKNKEKESSSNPSFWERISSWLFIQILVYFYLYFYIILICT